MHRPRERAPRGALRGRPGRHARDDRGLALTATATERRLAVVEAGHHVDSMADLLVVDDDADLADMLADVLRDEGHVVRTARDGSQGLVRLAERLPDAVLLDVEMPLLTGPQMAVRMFLHDCGQEHIPIILQSGVKDLDAVAGLVRTPYFLSKPFSLDDMLSVVSRALVERLPPCPVALV